MDPITVLFLIALGVGLVAALIPSIVVIVKYKKKLKAPIYPIDKFCALDLIDSRDDYIGSTVTKVRIRQNRD